MEWMQLESIKNSGMTGILWISRTFNLWFGHVQRMQHNMLPKTILSAEVPGNLCRS